MIPDFFSDEYYKKASTAAIGMLGTTLSNLLPAQVCDPLIREVFAEELIPRSEQLVEEVRKYTQEAVVKLCEVACAK